MVLTNEDLRAIAGLLHPINGRLDEIENKVDAFDSSFYTLEDKVDILSLKHDLAHKKLDDLSLDVKVAERDTRRDINLLKDSTETLVVVLKEKGILPKAQ